MCFNYFIKGELFNNNHSYTVLNIIGFTFLCSSNGQTFLYNSFPISCLTSTERLLKVDPVIVNLFNINLVNET